MFLVDLLRCDYVACPPGRINSIQVGRIVQSTRGGEDEPDERIIAELAPVLGEGQLGARRPLLVPGQHLAHSLDASTGPALIVVVTAVAAAVRVAVPDLLIKR